MQIEGTKLIFIMNFSALDFFKFASRMPQIAQVKLVSTFKIFQGEGGHPWAPPPPEISSFFSLAIPGSVKLLAGRLVDRRIANCLSLPCMTMPVDLVYSTNK